MNSYGDPSSARGRAQFPGANGDHGPADDPYRRTSRDDQADADRRSAEGDRGGWPANGRADGASARASVSGRAPSGRAAPPGRPPAGGGWAAPVSPASGSASVGSASVGSASPGRARVGRAGVGSAAVPGAPGSGGGYGDAPAAGRASAGRASVGAASVSGAGANGTAGRARVGRAVVPVSPAGPGGPDDPDGPGGAGGSGGRRGRRGGEPDAAALKRAKKRKRMNLVIAAFAVLIMLTGGGVVGVTYYSTNVVLPDEIPLPVGTTIFADDNRSQIVKLGEEARVIVSLDKIPDYVQKAVAAAEDRKFYKHKGVDYLGIARAAWNNFTGGTKQGASTITQQYARNAYENLNDDSYQRKVKEAILASKLNDEFTKAEIMQHYLNTIYFGRGAYGIEMAARTYFGKGADKLTVAESAVLAGVIKQPVNDPQTGVKGFDPEDNPELAKDRWTYVINGMLEEKWITEAERPTEYPAVKDRTDASASSGVKTPKGNVVNYVRAEMAEKGICHDGPVPAGSTKPTCQATLAMDGYKIKTSINMKMQNAAELAAQQEKKESPLNDQPKNLQAALVSIEPATGRVLAYYGGNDGTGIDYAGKNTLGGELVGGHPPGSSFKVYTLAAAIDAGISLESHWNSEPFKAEGIKDEIGNAGAEKTTCHKYCTLEQSTVRSYNVPFYHISEEIGPGKIVNMAKQAGITTMWTTPPKGASKPINLAKTQIDDKDTEPFFHVAAYGQYPITVLDHATGLATLANRGKYNKPHFILTIEQQDKQTGAWKKISAGSEQLKSSQRIKPEVADEVTSVLKKIPGANSRSLEGGRAAAGKTGTWQYGNTKDNAHAWMVGYTPQLATAVWVGSDNPRKPQIRKSDNNPVSGASLPGEIWQQYMSDALKGDPKKPLPDSKGIGDPDRGNGVKPPPPPPCSNPVNGVCPPQNQNQNPDNTNPPFFPTNPNPGNPPGPGDDPGDGDDPDDGRGGGGGGGGVAVLPNTTTGLRD
ncbi:transglycosylase domain-containing protein [Plantactinospora soyae]|uniref:Membrane peptidoglycan carboxypeptidase n=1 Tax=Plantactinospora soyae TaxID=1544732 RepID=A0A927QVS5_9ACTN|nr:transglycosylase domain-containing protein [Plantactinospora soyae]MBE1486075.1 membrane peptidoglycan carboxypeptidase [Plantactinospora soyae]